MQLLKRKDVPSCPKTSWHHGDNRRYRWLRWTLPIAGLFSLLWFLIRVIPKPSRATYPCQRAAFPLASGFVVWLLGLVASTVAFRKAKLNFARRRLVVGLLGAGTGVAAIWLAISAAGERLVSAQPQPANSPIGVAKGIHPGRVVWVHDPKATNWGGPGDGHWWQSNRTNQAAVDAMVSRAIRHLTAEPSDAAAWDAIFRYHNETRGKGSVGYNQGEKIAIKVNFVGLLWRHGKVNADTYELEGWRDYMNTSPQMITALIRQLVEVVGVEQSDITLTDTIANLANDYYRILHSSFPNVRYVDYSGKFGRIKTRQSSVPVYWSCNPKVDKQDYVPACYAEAEYLINLANLKAHTAAGVTLCAKNHYGSLTRWPCKKGYYDLHPSAFDKGNGKYRNLVDFMGHSHIGGKTALFLIDGLYSGKHPSDSSPRKWRSAPFNGDWTSSLLASQDPVAIDSVGLDFLQAEWDDYPHRPGAGDYLREAALADNPPSGTFYDPDHKGNVKRLTSLGVHEHWNNAKEKKYSRNLGSGKGIELVQVTSASGNKASIIAPGAKVVKLADGFEFTEGPAVDAEGNVFFTDQPNNRIHKWSVDGNLSVFHDKPGRSNGLYFDRDGNLLACADLNNELWLIDMQGNVTVLVKEYKGKKLNGPNDLWVDLKGGIYFTDPLYKRPYWTRDPAMQQDGQHVYYLSPGRQELIRVADDLVQPNGIIGTPDGRLLYVADIGARKTYVYRTNADGTLSDKKLFRSMGSDGMTIDNEGNIYLTGRGVTVFNPAGEKIEQIPIDAGWTANVCFGGQDRHTLFITAQKSLFALQMRVKGVQ
ncbi:MAG: SMP-30/gluconolactonase/LRE family protein [Phycisphaerales bacterium]|nr:MAG: SMP-30/gluconolactonase/LRE family protein [Phycisphaerales bacterium]